MDAIIAALLAVVAGLLFYRFVERRHKILLGKVVAGLIGLLIVGVGSMFWISERRSAAEERLRRSVTVTLIEPSDSLRRAWLEEEAMFGKYRAGPRSIPSGSISFTSVTFRLCNEGRDLVDYVEFLANSYFEGRSTPYPINARGETWDGASFASDHILTPGKCVTLTWEGDFIIRGPVVARSVEVHTTDSYPGDTAVP